MSAQWRQHLELLNGELSDRGILAELCVVGGAVLALALNADPTTRRASALFESGRLIDEAAERVAEGSGLPAGWLAETVKACLDAEPSRFLELSNLRIFIALPAYVLAMKCAGLSSGEDPEARQDVRYLLRYMNVSTTAGALALVKPYLGDGQLGRQARSVLEELGSD